MLITFDNHHGMKKMLILKKNLFLKTLLSLMLIAGVAFSFGWLPAIASDDHNLVKDLNNRGEIISLSELISSAGLTEVKILEAELEREHGKLVYELEFLDDDGKVYEQYFDAITGEALSGPRRD